MVVKGAIVCALLVVAQEVAPVSLKCLDSFRDSTAVSQGAAPIEPSGNDRTRQVDADFDTACCINFTVRGKPSPSGATPANPTGFNTVVVHEFADPSSTTLRAVTPLM